MLLLVAAPACKPPARATEAPLSPDTARLRAAALERRLAKEPADDAAALELAHLQWLHLRAANKAIPTLDRLAAKGDPIAQMSRMLLADARLDLREVRAQAQALIRGAARRGAASTKAADKATRTATDATEVDDRTRVALAELAARYLGENHGELPDDDADFLRFFAEVERLDLPIEVSQPLLSLRANLARRLDQPYLGYYDAQGCVRAWQVGELEGHLEAFELRRAASDPGAFVADPKATLTPLSCAVRTWNPIPRAGMRRLRTYLTVPGRAADDQHQRPGAGARLPRRRPDPPQRSQRPLAEQRHHRAAASQPGRAPPRPAHRDAARQGLGPGPRHRPPRQGGPGRQHAARRVRFVPPRGRVRRQTPQRTTSPFYSQFEPHERGPLAARATRRCACSSPPRTRWPTATATTPRASRARCGASAPTSPRATC
jgi:hypothetical protein